MGCLYDYIGITGFGSQEPLSGLFINQLPGITLNKIEKVAEKINPESTIAATWSDIQKRAWTRLEKDLRIALRNKYRLKGIKSSAFTKQEINTGNLVPLSDKYKGIVLDMDVQFASFLTLCIDKVVVHTADPGEVANKIELKIFDVDGKVLKAATKDNAVPGKHTFDISGRYGVSKVFIAVDGSLLNLYGSTIPKSVIDSCYQCAHQVCETCEPKIYGAHSEKDTPGTLTKDTGFYGIEVAYTVACDYSGIVCRNKPEFTDVWLYCLGVELMLENMYSTRMNRFTTIDRDQARELKDHYTVEYQKALNETVGALDVKGDDCCIECGSSIVIRETLP